MFRKFFFFCPTFIVSVALYIYLLCVFFSDMRCSKVLIHVQYSFLHFNIDSLHSLWVKLCPCLWARLASRDDLCRTSSKLLPWEIFIFSYDFTLKMEAKKNVDSEYRQGIPRLTVTRAQNSNRSFAWYGHLLRNQLCCMGRKFTQWKVGLDWCEFLCFGSPTVLTCVPT